MDNHMTMTRLKNDCILTLIVKKTQKDSGPYDSPCQDRQ